MRFAFRPLAALALVASLLVPSSALAEAADVAAYKKAVDANFAKWLQDLWPEAEAAGVSRETFDASLKGLKLDWSLPHLVFPDSAGPGRPPLPASLAATNKPKHQPE